MTIRGNSLASRDIATLVHPYTNLKAHQQDGPTVMTKAQGVYVYDEFGKQYIEGLAGLWCASLGFNEERLVEAAAQQMRKLPYYHIFAGKSHDVGIELAEKLGHLSTDYRERGDGLGGRNGKKPRNTSAGGPQDSKPKGPGGPPTPEQIKQYEQKLIDQCKGKSPEEIKKVLV